MRNKKWLMAINWLMLISLIVAFGSGILLKFMPGMWMGISHTLSGLLLVITVVIHIVQHGMFQRKRR